MSDYYSNESELGDLPEFGPLKTIYDHFTEHELKGMLVDWKEKTLRFQMCCDHTNVNVRFKVSEGNDTMQVFFTLPVLVANEKMRPVVADYLMRCNYGLIVGAFETDLNDGELRFHITHIIENESLSDDVIGRCFSTGMHMLDRYFPSLMSVCYGGVSPSQAHYNADLERVIDSMPDEPPVGSSKKKKQSKRRKRPLNESASGSGKLNPDTGTQSPPNERQESSGTTPPDFQSEGDSSTSSGLDGEF